MSLTFSNRDCAFLLSDSPISRDSITLAEGENLESGTVLGQITIGDAAAEAGGTNTGNGTLTLDATAPIGTSAQAGTYTLACTQQTGGTVVAYATIGAGNTGEATIAVGSPAVTTATGLGVYTIVCTETSATAAFKVLKPDGSLLGTGAVGTEFLSSGLKFTITDAGANPTAGDKFYVNVLDNTVAKFSVTAPDYTALTAATVGTTYNTSHLKFALAQGATKFILGDSFTITIESGSGEYVAYDGDARDGSQIARGILLKKIDATDGAQSAVMVARYAEVVSNRLQWKTGNDTNEKTTALAALQTNYIFARS